MILFTFGSPRSGSTWLHNVVRRLLILSKISFRAGFSSDPGAALKRGLNPNLHEVIVLKSHRWGDLGLLNQLVEEGLARVLVSTRETTSQIRSMTRIAESSEKQRPEKTVVDRVSELRRRTAADLENLAALRPYLSIQEADMRNNPEQAVNDVARFLGLKLSRFDLNKIAKEFTIDAVHAKILSMSEERGWRGSFNEYDRETHWHANHIGDDDTNDTLDFSSPDVRALVSDAEAVRSQIGRHSSREARLDLRTKPEDPSGLQLAFLSTRPDQAMVTG